MGVNTMCNFPKTFGLLASNHRFTLRQFSGLMGMKFIVWKKYFDHISCLSTKAPARKKEAVWSTQSALSRWNNQLPKSEISARAWMCLCGHLPGPWEVSWLHLRIRRGLAGIWSAQICCFCSHDTCVFAHTLAFRINTHTLSLIAFPPALDLKREGGGRCWWAKKRGDMG